MDYKGGTTAGKARVDRRTKNLLKRLHPHEIAVIDHADLDEVSANGLVAARAKAVINASPSITGRYPNPGPRILVQAGIPLIDNVGPEIMERVREGDRLEIENGLVLRSGEKIAAGKVLSVPEIEKKMTAARENLRRELDRFVENTLEYAKQEKDLILGDLPIPNLGQEIRRRDVLVVVRGANYKEDLVAIRPYVEEVRPYLIGVDGGADALMEFGWRPDLIVGDMDSITDGTLKCGAPIVVHAYPDGRAPGLKRVQGLGLHAAVFPAPGTSEDIALLLAYERGAALIVAVGTHSNMIDFLEKGRAGMASTFLVRLKVGSILVDARGVSRLYRGRLRASYFLQIALAALIPAAVIAGMSTPLRQFWQLLVMKLKLVFGL